MCGFGGNYSMSRNLSEYTAIIFDLDNTLYEEKDYLNAAYSAIGHWVFSQNKNQTAILYAIWLQQNFEKHGRQGLFNRFLEQFELSSELLPGMLQILRSVQIKTPLNLYPELYALPEKITRSDIKYFIVTNGNPEQQLNKIRQINWEKLVITECILASNSKPKPAPDALVGICTHYAYLPSEVLFVGDAPTDKIAADAAGIDFMDAIHFRELLKQ